jgi:hypothetical protein
VDPQQFPEFYDIRTTACDGLCSGRFVADARGLVCRLVALPSFENAVAWEVRSGSVQGKSVDPRLFRSCWRRVVDTRAFGSPMERLRHPRPYSPTIEATSAPIEATKIEAMIRKFRETPIPLAVSAPDFIGLDGTRYQLELADSYRHARTAPVCRGPDAVFPA